MQLDFAVGAAKTHRLPVEIVEKPIPKPTIPRPKDDTIPDQNGDSTKIIKVKIRKKDFTEAEIPVVEPTLVKREDSLWQTLGWSLDPDGVGFSMRSVGGKVHLYYNAEFPPFLDLKHWVGEKTSFGPPSSA